jgi:peptidoglycan hydrolase-like protein with peptidoglycan-binding domain
MAGLTEKGMNTLHQTAAVQRNRATAHRRRGSEVRRRIGEQVAVTTSPLLAGPEKIGPARLRSLLARADPAHRADIVRGIQQTHGNAYVQRVLSPAEGLVEGNPVEGQPAQSEDTLRSPRFAGNTRLNSAVRNSPAMHVGESGEAVRLVQDALVRDGAPMPGSTKPTGELDGGFGGETFGVVKQFQQKHGLDVDGIVGRQTLRRLDALEGTTTNTQPIVSTSAAGVAGFLSKVDHYIWEIKAWIPLAQVPDPEEALQEARFRLAHLGDEVSAYHSQYRGDAHAGYAGSARVIHRVEFDWDGTRVSNFAVTPLQHFGTTHREFSALVNPIGGVRSRAIRDQESGTTDRAVSESHPNPSEVRMGMASPNPLTLFPAPDIDADYTLFISRDFGEDTITVRWSTDLMPNHGFRVEKNGNDLKERVVNALPGPLLAPEIFLRLTSKANGGADTITTLPG